MQRGINIGNALEAPREGEWRVYIRDEYFRIIRGSRLRHCSDPYKMVSPRGY
jgi:endoglucanase